jgi:cytochrome d ubiquinol oxidase subunit II
MQLADGPVLLMLLGLAAYMVLGGADFGTGVWELTAPRGRRGDELREYVHDAIGPVWEANHVWLIFVLVVFWSSYPTAFGSVMTTLAIPFFIAAVGVVLRGTSYALRPTAGTVRERGAIDHLFALSSILTPFALGTAIGGIACGRVPVGNAAGDLVASWLNPPAIIVGAIAVAASAHLSAVYLTADATRAGKRDLVPAFRARALVSGVVAGALSIAGLIVVHANVPPLFAGLTQGAGLVAVIVSGAAGVATLVLVWGGRFALARFAAAVAVAAVIAGWAAAQQPYILPGLTIQAAAAGDATLITILVVAAIGAVILVPSLVLLFGLFLQGRFDPGREAAAAVAVTAARRPPQLRRGAPIVALFVAGAGLTLFAHPAWLLGLGIGILLVFVLGGFAVLASAIVDVRD